MMSVYGAAVRSSHPSTRALRAVALRVGDEETVMRRGRDLTGDENRLVDFRSPLTGTQTATLRL
jgi:hypothetical protein